MKLDEETLRAMIAEDKFGLLDSEAKAKPPTAEERLVAAFGEVTDFYEANNRRPKVNPADMSESRLAMRLSAMSASSDQRATLTAHDQYGLLREPKPPTTIADAIADDALGILGERSDLHDLKFVPQRKSAPDKVARREACEDFELFQPLFEACHMDLRLGQRRLIEFRNPRHIEVGKFFVLKGVLLYVAAIEPRKPNEPGPHNPRTRCIFENATEADLLLLSLGSSLYKGGKIVTEAIEELVPAVLDAATKMGSLYVLRSRSEDPGVAAVLDLHKIGSTVRSVEDRVARAETSSTFLNAPVEIVAEYQLPASAVGSVETMLHRFFASARLDIWFEREGSVATEANEWFDVPLDVVDEAIGLIQHETIADFRYDRDARRIRLAR